MGRSGKGSTTVGRPGWFPRVVTETDTGHEGPERPRGPTGGPLAATDGERRVGRALPRHGHALPAEPRAVTDLGFGIRRHRLAPTSVLVWDVVLVVASPVCLREITMLEWLPHKMIFVVCPRVRD